MADYLIRDIPADKMGDFKTACAHFKISMRQALLDSMDGVIHRYRQAIIPLGSGRKHTKKKEVKK